MLKITLLTFPDKFCGFRGKKNFYSDMQIMEI